jgi:acetolactate decarboxylase
MTVRWIFCLLILALLPVQTKPWLRADEPPSRQITQVSVINALMLGQYDGTTRLGDVLTWGNFGLGTVDHLDGELIILDGQAYQARSDGTVHPCKPDMTTPFAMVTSFSDDLQRDCPPAGTLEELEQALQPILPQPNLFVAVRIHATFDRMVLRAVPRQTPPYRPLAEVVKQQAQWSREQIPGTLIGIRCPNWVTGMSVPGFHWHFLSDDRQTGGHVFDCRLSSGTLAFTPCDTWVIRLSDQLGVGTGDLGQDLQKELDQVERQRGLKPAQ